MIPVTAPPRPRTTAPPRRSTTPPTLRLDDVRKLDAVRLRLTRALRLADTLPALRTYVAELAADIEDQAAQVEAELAPDTVRAPPCYPMPWEGDAAPPTPRASALGEEYGA